MKKYRQLVQELPSRKVVFAFGRFQPPTIGHELLVNAVKTIAHKQGADHVIFASKTQDKKQNPLPVDRKVHYMERMFPKTNFVAANDSIRTFIEAAAMLSKKYKNLIMVAGSDRVANFKELLEKYNGTTYNFETIEVVSAGERDPDSDSASGMSGTKMREAAKTGDFLAFKKGLPKTLTELDGKRLMNEIRQGLGLDAIKEHVEFNRTVLREKYHSGEIYAVGDRVTDGVSMFEVVSRGANYITVVNEEGDISKKWLESVTPVQIEEDILPGAVPSEVAFKGYKTKNLHHSEDAIKAFETTIDRYNQGKIKDPVAILNALKATDTYMKLNDLHLEQQRSPTSDEVKTWLIAHNKARDSLNRIGEFMHHMDYWHMHEHELQDLNTKYNQDVPETDVVESDSCKGELIEMKYSQSDKVKIAKVIANALGLDKADTMTNPEQLVNLALRHIKNKPMRPEYLEIIRNMLNAAREAGISYDEKLVPKAKDLVDEDISHELHRRAMNKMLGRSGDDATRKVNLAKVGADEKENESDQAATAQHKNPATTVGSGMHDPSTESPSARKMKIAYREDVTTSEFKVKEYIDSDGSTHTRKVRPRKVTFSADRQGVKEEKEQDFDDDFDDADIDNMVDSVKDEQDVIDVYDDDELALIDDDTGEHVSSINEEAINEVLSRMERIKAKARFAKTQTKRERKIKLALKSRSSTQTLNTRARRLAISLMKQKLAKKPLNTLSVAEKERLERIVQRKKAIINRMAMKLTTRIRQIENTRLSHDKFTK